MDKTKQRSKYLVSLLLLCFLFSFSLVSGATDDDQSNLGTHLRYTNITLSQTCDNCTYVNVTRIKYPNSTEIYPNAGMFNPVQGNYYYQFQDTASLGKYYITTCGNLNGAYSCETYNFKISTTGSDLIAMIPLFLLIAGYLLLAISIYKDIPIIGFASGIMLSIAGVYLKIYGLGFFLNIYTDTLAYISLFIGVIVAFAAIEVQLRSDGGEE